MAAFRLRAGQIVLVAGGIVKDTGARLP